jgi:hypothetical protein
LIGRRGSVSGRESRSFSGSFFISFQASSENYFSLRVFLICTTNLEFLEILLSKCCQDFPPHPPLSPAFGGEGRVRG